MVEINKVQIVHTLIVTLRFSSIMPISTLSLGIQRCHYLHLYCLTLVQIPWQVAELQ